MTPTDAPSGRPIRSVAVFCGSRFGVDPRYAEACAALGAGIAQAGLRLVYGGGHVGLGLSRIGEVEPEFGRPRVGGGGALQEACRPFRVTVRE